MDIKKDKVNRRENLVKVTLDLPPGVKSGDRIVLINVVEDNIDADIKDPMEGFVHHPDGDYGDAIFDPMAAGADDTVFDPDA